VCIEPDIVVVVVVGGGGGGGGGLGPGLQLGS
jgi:hypothetical protein